MESSSIWAGGRLVDLTESECGPLMATQRVGRLAWCGAGGPSVVPVNFTVHEDTVWIRTAPYTTLARECDGNQVAFEIDEIDDFTRSGWSVLIRGRAEIHRPDDLPDEMPGLEAWPSGSRVLFVAIRARETTGRRLLPS